MKLGCPHTRGNSQNCKHYLRKIKSSDAKGCNKFTSIKKKKIICENQVESPHGKDATNKTHAIRKVMDSSSSGASSPDIAPESNLAKLH